MRNRIAIVRILAFVPALFVLAEVRAQAPAKPLTQEELLRQIESLPPAASDPGRRTPAVMPVPGAPPRAAKADSREAGGGTAALIPGAPPRPDMAPKAEKKRKGPTEIVALEATFDQKAHVAVFIGQVVVTDPEFNVQADKLTAYLRHDDEQPAQSSGAAPSRLRPAATPASKAGENGGGGRKGGGFERAIAEADPGNVVTVMQDKEELDGSRSHSIGHGKKCHYDATTGDITLYGKPDVQQGINTCIATDESTVMTLNRDGHMRVTGPHKTVIRDQNELGK